MKDLEKGFYYHYKHDPKGDVNNYAYEVLNIAHHSEIDGVEESAMVVYRPLYESARAYKAGKHWDVRPLPMFIEILEKDGKKFSRFNKVTDENIITELEKVKADLYKDLSNENIIT